MEFINTNTDSSNNITFLHNPNMVSLDIPFLSMNIPNMVNLNPGQTQNYDTSFNNVINNSYYNENDMNNMNDIETDDYHEDSTNNLGMGITNPFDNSMNINTFLNVFITYHFLPSLLQPCSHLHLFRSYKLSLILLRVYHQAS